MDFRDIIRTIQVLIGVGAAWAYFKNLFGILRDRDNSKKYVKRIINITIFLAVSLTITELINIGKDAYGL